MTPQGFSRTTPAASSAGSHRPGRRRARSRSSRRRAIRLDRAYDRRRARRPRSSTRTASRPLRRHPRDADLPKRCSRCVLMDHALRHRAQNADVVRPRRASPHRLPLKRSPVCARPPQSRIRSRTRLNSSGGRAHLDRVVCAVLILVFRRSRHLCTVLRPLSREHTADPVRHRRADVDTAGHPHRRAHLWGWPPIAGATACASCA